MLWKLNSLKINCDASSQRSLFWKWPSVEQEEEDETDYQSLVNFYFFFQADLILAFNYSFLKTKALCARVKCIQNSAQILDCQHAGL